MAERRPKKINEFEIRKQQKALELDFKKIVFSEPEIKRARGVVAASAVASHDCSTDACDCALLMEHLGLMPHQNTWYEAEDKLARRPQNG